jgi:hypothetical protein
MLTGLPRDDVEVSPVVNFTPDFVDRQKMKMIENKILDVLVILESLRNTFSMLKHRCENQCLGTECKDCTCRRISEELEERILETQIDLRIAKVLLRRAEGMAQLVRSNLCLYSQLIRALTDYSFRTCYATRMP